ncbi:hypothetical protein [Nocardioides campestrisoli]|uniref:hypothetical protein n=1 Tax=Nocardioides campestrisoli TaxID=2736757 RepID=UPI0015E7C879|nr:hypothetical protein [Nocardioides campestrisoli]
MTERSDHTSTPPADLFPVPYDGFVFIRCTPATARRLADAWDYAHRLDETADAARHRWHDDVVNVRAAAIEADLQTGTRPDIALVYPLPRRQA